ncbi:putative estradiol 17 beta-dehydrogenase [Xylariaceae sp. FL0662B]|nr:putative estradiol 17 beta-dehydrogenase [Xylariaceae sp. FL0662B]
MASFSSIWTQFFPPKPRFTEKDVGDLSGRVYIVTGANSGLGKELSRILYSKNAKGNEAIESIKKAAPNLSGSLVFLSLDLDDLASVRAAAERFLAAEIRLHVLFNNAGYQGPESATERIALGYEKYLQVNCLGLFLLTRLLTPILVATAEDAATPPNTVRAVFIFSCAAEMLCEKDVGFNMDNLDYHIDKPSKYRYGISKLGSWAYGVELSKRFKGSGIIGVPINPAYAELWAGLLPEVTAEKAGAYAVPFGRFYPICKDLDAAAKSEAEGGNGTTGRFWDWSEEQVKGYL